MNLWKAASVVGLLSVIAFFAIWELVHLAGLRASLLWIAVIGSIAWAIRVSKLRIRVSGRILHALGLVELWDSGIQCMTAACREAGLAAPVFEELATRFRVTITTRALGPPVLDETDQTILARLANGEGWLTSEIAAEIGLTPRATRTRLAKLVGRGLVREIGTGPQDPRRRYYMAKGGAA